MKIGDTVRSDQLELEGVIQDIHPCLQRGCNRDELTLDPEEHPVRGYYHPDTFVLVAAS